MAQSKRPKPQKMKSYKTFTQWKQDQSKDAQSLIQSLRSIVRKAAPSLTETVKWGNGCWINKDELPAVYIHVMTKGVQLGFFAGAMVSDPKGRLEGKGKFIRFIPVKDKADIDATYFSTLIKRAAKIQYK